MQHSSPAVRLRAATAGVTALLLVLASCDPQNLDLFTAAPVFDPAPGEYPEAVTITIASETPDAVIYYTTDGSEPSFDSDVYEGPLSLSVDQAELWDVQAIAQAPGLLASEVQGGIYTLSGIAPPANLALVRSGIATVQVSWADNSDRETGYAVERNGVVIATLAADAESFTDSGLPISADPLSYRVRAVGDATNSRWTASAVITTELVEHNATAGDAAAGDEFGWTVSIDGDTAVVGAHLDDNGGLTDAGSAYVFTRSGGGWTQAAKLTANDAAAGDGFGHYVSLSGDTALVGAPNDDHGGLSDAGSAYVFVRPSGGWVDATEDAKLTASDAAASDRFGDSVSLSGDTALVGAVWDDHGGLTDAGSAYVFVRPSGGWVDATEDAKLTASDAAADDQFGVRVSLSGDTALVGVWLDDDGGTDSGSAYIFTRSAGVWTQAAKLTASDAAADDRFGNQVSLSGDTALVGAFWDDHGGLTDAGSAYVFVRPAGGWVDATEDAKLTASDPGAGDEFGNSVSLSGDTALVGARYDDDVGSNSGSAYIFVRPSGGWVDTTEDVKLTASDPGAGDTFSFSVSLSGNTAMVGALLDDEAGTDAGSVYFFGP